MLTQIKKLFEILPTSDKVKMLALLGMMFVGAFLEMVGIGMIPAFVSVIAAPEQVLGIAWLKPVWDFFRIEDGGDLLVLGGIALILVFIVKNAYLVFYKYIEGRYIFNRYSSIGSGLFARYMRAPYTFVLSRNTAGLLRNITQDAHFMIHNVLMPTLQLAKDSIMIVGVFAMLIYFEPLISFIVMVLLGGAGALLLKGLRSRIKGYGSQAQADREKMIKTVNEGMGGLKDISVLKRENWFIKRFRQYIDSYARSQSFMYVTSSGIKPVMETIAVSGMMIIALLLYAQGRSLEAIIPIMTLFAAGILRLMPAIQTVVQNFNKLRYYNYSLDSIHHDLSDLSIEERESDRSVVIDFTDSIKFENASYTYPNARRKAVDSLSLEILKEEAIGFVGPSGAGKTTVVDMLLGLLEPTGGSIMVDGTNIFENVDVWKGHVGYIPQHIFLSDDTLRRNVAFGLSDDAIEEEHIQRAVEAAQLREMIDSLDDGLDTIIGERGIRLSGGQRQRIGIARALYHDPSVLIMDEATSALDNVTEKYVINSIERLKGERTIIMIAHRLTTVQNCDRLYFMKDGRVVDQGSYNELVSRNPEFQKMAMVD